jgi:hypothetical protein
MRHRIYDQYQRNGHLLIISFELASSLITFLMQSIQNVIYYEQQGCYYNLLSIMTCPSDNKVQGG